MKGTTRYAALLAALILALGLVALPQAAVATGNSDVEFLQPPGGDSGDPDMPGPNKFFLRVSGMISRARAWFLPSSSPLRSSRVGVTQSSPAQVRRIQR